MARSLSGQMTTSKSEEIISLKTPIDVDSLKEILETEEYDSEKGQKETKANNRIWTKWLFFLGFLFPILWIIGSRLSLKDYNSDQGFIWKKRCRIAVTIMLTLGIVASVLVMIFNPQAFGLRRNTSAGPQTSSNSNSALRPDVPVNGTSTTGDIIAGIIVAGQ
ncbi:unnamed protein product [Umbelopsis vinacea]